MNLKGVLTGVRSIPTSTGRPMVVCRIGQHRCKVFSELAQMVLANQYDYEDREHEVYGYLDRTDVYAPEFVIQGFGKDPMDRSSTIAVPQKGGSDNRPDKPSMKITENFVVITIPHGVTHQQLQRITDAASEALRGLETNLGNGISELVALHVTEQDPILETEDFPF